jgi:hypothetical protein
MLKTVAPLTVVSIRCPSVVYVNFPLIVLNISCPSVSYVNNPSYSFRAANINYCWMLYV